MATTQPASASAGAPPTQQATVTSQTPNVQVANLIAHLARASNNGEAANPIQQMLARMPPNESASVIAQFSSKPGTTDAAAEALNSLAAQQQQAYPNLGQPLPGQFPPVAHGLPVADPGPSSHPNGPPIMGQVPPPPPPPLGAQETEEGDEEGGDGETQETQGQTQASTGSTGRRGARAANMGSEEWARQRKDNHKEVERRRRGNINEGINELGRIVPNGSGEKAKGAILSRAVQYIHHLKENEARNIEKWTLEKLLMDQAMGDLQSQLDEMRRMWEEERQGRQRAESELELLRGLQGNGKEDKEDIDGDEQRGAKRQRVE